MLFHGLLYIYLSLWFAVYGQLIDHVSGNLKTSFFLLFVSSPFIECVPLVHKYSRMRVESRSTHYQTNRPIVSTCWIHTRTKFDLAHYHEPMRNHFECTIPLASLYSLPPPGEKRGIIRENIGLDRKWLEFLFFLFKKKTNPIFVLFLSLNLPL